MIKRWVTRLGVVALLLGAGVAVTSAPAQAYWSDCPSQYVCAFPNSNGGGAPLFAIYRSPGTCYSLDAADNDQADSFRVRLTNGKAVQAYKDVNCTGTRLILNCCSDGPFPAGTMSNFSSGPIVDNRNKLSSVFFNN